MATVSPYSRNTGSKLTTLVQLKATDAAGYTPSGKKAQQVKFGKRPKLSGYRPAPPEPTPRSRVNPLESRLLRMASGKPLIPDAHLIASGQRSALLVVVEPRWIRDNVRPLEYHSHPVCAGTLLREILDDFAEPDA